MVINIQGTLPSTSHNLIKYFLSWYHYVAVDYDCKALIIKYFIAFAFSFLTRREMFHFLAKSLQLSQLHFLIQIAIWSCLDYQCKKNLSSLLISVLGTRKAHFLPLSLALLHLFLYYILLKESLKWAFLNMTDCT